MVLNSPETGVVDSVELKAAKNEMGESKYAQEFECSFDAPVEGSYYGELLGELEEKKHMQEIPWEELSRTFTAWDLGMGDSTSIWVAQLVGSEVRLIDYYENHGEDLKHYIKYLQDAGYIFNKHFLPHDADHVRLGKSNKSTKQMLKELGLSNIVIVPVTSSINEAIQLTRTNMASAYFDEAACKDGLKRLANYKKRWNKAAGRWSDEPMHDANSEGADAFRQWAQAKASGLVTMGGSTPRVKIPFYKPTTPGMGM